MSVLQNINGTLARMDASDLVQLAAVDTEGILGGTPGAQTDGQTLVDQLAADDVQAQTDIGQIKTDLSDQQGEISAICNVYGSKNLLRNEAYTQTINGVTLTVYDDGSVKANGTASADVQLLLRMMSNSEYVNSFGLGHKYILSGCPSGGASDKYMIRFHADPWGDNIQDFGDGVEFTVTDAAARVRRYAWIIIRSGVSVSNIMFYPMIRDARIKDSTYVPYVPTNRECVSYAVNGVLGAKNLIPFPYREGSTTKSGTTYIVNSDGSITLLTDAQGATAQSYITLASQDTPGLRETLLRCKQLTLSGGESASIWLNINSPSVTGNNKDSGNGVTVPFTNTSNPFNIALVVESGTIITTPVTVYPLLTVASDTDRTYQPFAMTNGELTGRFNLEMTSGSILDVNKTCFFFASADCSNLPVSGRGCLVQMIYNTINFKTCLVSPYNMQDIYINIKAGNNWSGWKKFASVAI